MKKILLSILVSFIFTSVLVSQTVISDQEFQQKAISNALEFDGVDDYVAIPGGTGIFANLEEFSMCCWVYPTNPSAAWPDFEGFLGIKDEFVCDFYIAQINGLGIEARITTNVGTYTIDPPMVSQVTINEWSHYALVYTGTELQLYLNGELDGSIGALGVITQDYLELTFGKLVFGTNDFYLDGKLDEVTFWSKALTEEEIQEYQCISGDPSSVPDLIAYYNFNEEDGLNLPDHFENYDGTLTNMNGDEWIESEVCESGFTISFNVVDEETSLPVENAAVNLQGVIKNTDVSGMVEFTNYDPGVYAYEVTKNDYYDSSGEVTVIDEDIVEEVILSPVLYYDITFIVTEEPSGTPIEDAIVNVDGILQFTNDAGTTTFTGYLPDNYPYTVTKEGYPLVTGTAELIDEDLLIEVGLLIDQVVDKLVGDYNIYPNPAKDRLFIENSINSGSGNTYIYIFSVEGEEVLNNSFHNQSLMEMDINQLLNGVYFLKIKSDNGVSVQKLVIK